MRSILWVLSRFSCVQLFVTPGTVACQAPLSMGSPGKNTGVGCHFLLQRIFPTQGSNPRLPGLLHWLADPLPTEPPGEVSQHQVCSKAMPKHPARELFAFNNFNQFLSHVQSSRAIQISKRALFLSNLKNPKKQQKQTS